MAERMKNFPTRPKRDALLEHKTKTLSRKLRRLLPALDGTVMFVWTGSLGETDTGRPIIAQVPKCRIAGWRSAMAQTGLLTRGLQPMSSPAPLPDDRMSTPTSTIFPSRREMLALGDPLSLSRTVAFAR